MPSRYLIAFYQRQDGSCPLDDYMLSITNDDEYITVINVIQYLGFVGQVIIDTKMANRIDGPICELRKNRHRIMYAEDKSRNGFIMLSAFLKETRKTPQEEIEKAHRHWQDYQMYHRSRVMDIPLDEKLLNL